MENVNDPSPLESVASASPASPEVRAGLDGAGAAGESEAASLQPGWFQCVAGSAIAAVFGYGAYALTRKIALNFAAHPFTSENYIAVRISLTVRTLVVGCCTLAMALFGFAALGLFVLGLQTALKQFRAASAVD